MSRKWWQGWVRVSCYSFAFSCEQEFTLTTDYVFSTAGQAKRAADALAGGLAKGKRFTIIETGASLLSDRA